VKRNARSCGVFRVGERCFPLCSILAAAASPGTQAVLANKGMKIVVDCVNGAAYNVAPHVFHELGADVAAVGVKPDGFNINEKSKLSSEVQSRKADLGIAFDGDADRVLMVDAEGRAYDGDELLYAIVRHRKPGGLAGTLITNFAFEKQMGKLGIAFARAKVGDRYVLELMREKGWQLGGENSGHIICLDKHTTGDGIVSALQVLHAIRESGRSLKELNLASVGHRAGSARDGGRRAARRDRVRGQLHRRRRSASRGCVACSYGPCLSFR